MREISKKKPKLFRKTVFQGIMNQIYFSKEHIRSQKVDQQARSNLFHDNNQVKYTFSYRFLFNPCYRRSETGPARAALTARRWILSLAPTQRRKLPRLFPEVSASRGSAIATPREVNSLTSIQAFFLFPYRYLNSKVTLLSLSTNWRFNETRRS